MSAYYPEDMHSSSDRHTVWEGGGDPDDPREYLPDNVSEWDEATIQRVHEMVHEQATRIKELEAMGREVWQYMQHWPEQIGGPRERCVGEVQSMIGAHVPNVSGR